MRERMVGRRLRAALRSSRARVAASELRSPRGLRRPAGPSALTTAPTKAGIEALTRAVAIEVARRGVTVNSIQPGLVLTDFVPEATEDWAQAIPAKRSAAPEEIAALVRFLASEEAAYITGTVIPIDGGF